MRRSPVLGLLVLLLAVPAQAMDVTTRFDPEVDFQSFRTYAWKKGPELPREDPLAVGGELDRKVRQAVEEELRRVGLVPATEGKPDLWVVCFGSTTNLLQIASDDTHIGDWLDFQDDFEDPHRDIRQYEEGTLVVDLVDARSNELVWSSWVTGTARTLEGLRRKADKRIVKAVRRMFRDFPGR